MAANGIFNDVAFKSSGIPAAGATVRVGPSTATGTPLTPLSSLYSDAGLSIAKTNPLTADANGNFWFYAAPGVYKLQVSYSGSTYTYTAEVSQSSDSIATDGLTTSGITPPSSPLYIFSSAEFRGNNLTNIGSVSAVTFNGNSVLLTNSLVAGTGASWMHGYSTEQITLSTSGSTTDSAANLLPANSIIEAVVAYVITTITTATDWKLGDATISGRFSAPNSTMTAGTTQIGLVHVDQTGTSGPRQTAAAKLRITTTGTPGAGKIRVTVFYRQFAIV
jgi:hypothetical protein